MGVSDFLEPPLFELDLQVSVSPVRRSKEAQILLQEMKGKKPGSVFQRRLLVVYGLA